MSEAKSGSGPRYGTAAPACRCAHAGYELLDISPNPELVSERGRTDAAHYAELLPQVRQILHLRGWPGSLRHSSRTAGPAPAQQVAKNLPEDISARCHGTGRSRLGSSTRTGTWMGPPCPPGEGI